MAVLESTDSADERGAAFHRLVAEEKRRLEKKWRSRSRSKGLAKKRGRRTGGAGEDRNKRRKEDSRHEKLAGILRYFWPRVTKRTGQSSPGDSEAESEKQSDREGKEDSGSAAEEDASGLQSTTEGSETEPKEPERRVRLQDMDDKKDEGQQDTARERARIEAARRKRRKGGGCRDRSRRRSSSSNESSSTSPSRRQWKGRRVGRKKAKKRRRLVIESSTASSGVSSGSDHPISQGVGNPGAQDAPT